MTATTKASSTTGPSSGFPSREELDKKYNERRRSQHFSYMISRSRRHCAGNNPVWWISGVVTFLCFFSSWTTIPTQYYYPTTGDTISNLSPADETPSYFSPDHNGLPTTTTASGTVEMTHPMMIQDLQREVEQLRSLKVENSNLRNTVSALLLEKEETTTTPKAGTASGGSNPIRHGVSADGESNISDTTIGSATSSTGHSLHLRRRHDRSAAKYSLCDRIPSNWYQWVDHQDTILAATQDHKLDTNFTLRDRNAMALQFIMPRLYRSIRTVPRDLRRLEHLLEKVQRRWDYLQKGGNVPNTGQRPTHDDTITNNTQLPPPRPPPPPPPIRILVSGGSVAEGHSCKTNIRAIYGTKCAWPYRLERIVNNLAGGELVQVINGARGGSNSQVGRALFRYGLMVPPTIAKENHDDGDDVTVDVVINAHSVNDQHIVTIKEAEDMGVPLEEYILDMTQNFTRDVLSLTDYDPNPNCKNTTIRPPPPPVLLWLDDYLGNEHLDVLKLTGLSKSIHVLSNYYGFGVASYADAVRDVVYGDTMETILSPPWYDSGDGGQKKKMVRGVHPGPFMQTSVAYIWLHYFWTVANHVCSRVGTVGESIQQHNQQQPVRPSLDIDYYEEELPWERMQSSSDNNKETWPRPRPRGLPPRLTPDLRLDEISEKWRQVDTPTTKGTNNSADCEVATPSSNDVCPFRWTMGIIRGYDRSALESDSIQIFKPYLHEPTSWELTQGDFGQGRVGWSVYRNDSNTDSSDMMLVLDFPFTDVNTIGLFIAKSVDPLWKDSMINVTIRDPLTQNVLKSQTFQGYAYTSSDPLGQDLTTTAKAPSKRQIKAAMNRLVYLEEMDLRTSNDDGTDDSTTHGGKGLRMELQLVSGFGFKLMGLALCRFPATEGVAILPINNQ